MVKLTQHYVERSIERGISQTEVRDVLAALAADTPIGRASRLLLRRGETVTFRSRGVALVVVSEGADVQIITTYRYGGP